MLRRHADADVAAIAITFRHAAADACRHAC